MYYYYNQEYFAPLLREKMFCKRSAGSVHCILKVIFLFSGVFILLQAKNTCDVKEFPM